MRVSKSQSHKWLEIFWNRLEMVLVGKQFWELWGGRVLHAVVMSSIVAFTLQFFDSGVKQFVDTTIQSTLLNQMGEQDFALPECAGSHAKEAANCITVVGIDDTDYRGVFQQQSPLNPAELQKLFDQMRQHPPHVVAIDLDLSPAYEAELPARESLRQSLLELSRVSKIVMVCPQGYSTPEPSEFDKNWVDSFDSNVKFASADLDAEGLYYSRHVTHQDPKKLDEQTIQTLGVVAAEFIRPPKEDPAVSGSTGEKNWHLACKTSALSITGKSENIKKRVLRPVAVQGTSFTQALNDPGSLANRVVLVGSKWGISDRFTLRGQTDQFFGVTLHAWAVASELAPQTELPAPLMLILDVLIGLLAGIAFAFIWKRVFRYKSSFALRSCFYILFFFLAIAVPLAMIAGAAHLAKLGITLVVAGMILSSAADSVLSSHEVLLDQEDDRARKCSTHCLPSTSPGFTANQEPQPPFFLISWFGILVLLVTAIAATFFLDISGVNLLVWPLFGASFGLLFALVDRTNFSKSIKYVEQTRETKTDLFFRFVWMVLKIAALAWAMADIFRESGPATLLMVFFFIFSWPVAVGGLYLTRHRNFI